MRSLLLPRFGLAGHLLEKNPSNRNSLPSRIQKCRVVSGQAELTLAAFWGSLPGGALTVRPIHVCQPGLCPWLHSQPGFAPAPGSAAQSASPPSVRSPLLFSQPGFAPAPGSAAQSASPPSVRFPLLFSQPGFAPAPGSATRKMPIPNSLTRTDFQTAGASVSPELKLIEDDQD